VNMSISAISQNTSFMEIDKRNINAKEVKEYLDNVGYVIDLDEKLKDNIFTRYILDNGEYLITADFMDEGIIFSCKNNYLDYMKTMDSLPKISQEPKYCLDLGTIFENSSCHIDNLSKRLELNLSNSDLITNLKQLDDYFLGQNKSIDNYDFNLIREELFAYFSRVISNEIRNTDYVSEINEEGDLFFYLFDKNKKYEIYQPFRDNLFRINENFSFFSRARFILSDFRLRIQK